jgi:hypothetical protein
MPMKSIQATYRHICNETILYISSSDDPYFIVDCRCSMAITGRWQIGQCRECFSHGVEGVEGIRDGTASKEGGITILDKNISIGIITSTGNVDQVILRQSSGMIRYGFRYLDVLFGSLEFNVMSLDSTAQQDATRRYDAGIKELHGTRVFGS